MPRRADLDSILLIGSGPIVIGQACEFDYSGTQACKALRAEGVRVVLLNSNPATIMTDPDMAAATYIEPLTLTVLDDILARENVRAILPTLGGQTALNLAHAASRTGVLERRGVELIGASVAAIEMAEDRGLFKQAMERIGLACCRSVDACDLAEARAGIADIGFPAVVRPSFTLGGAGSAIAHTAREFDEAVAWGLAKSPVHKVLIEESVLGWKEYELEVMRDRADNAIVVCSIENVDPMGVHTGDSITVAPAQTLTDREYQRMRDAALAIVRAIGVDTGGANIQFSVDPETGEQRIIEMNPRVSRSSALASKATGFPIAKIAAKLAIGYTLDEIDNDITRITPASFEPAIDYVVIKAPRFAFEKFPGARPVLGTQMKSVGEAMAFGRTFREALGKVIRSLEIGYHGLDWPVAGRASGDAAGDSLPARDQLAALREAVSTPTPGRLFQLAQALRLGMPRETAHRLTGIDPWFLAQLGALVDAERAIAALASVPVAERLSLVARNLHEYKRMGLSDRRLAALLSGPGDEPAQVLTETDIRTLRERVGLAPVYKRVDTCAGEFEAHTPYLYSTYEEECEADPSDRDKVIILGGGPNRIGQGIEFDYCCVHAALALAEAGYESIMVNCNPETVSTDYDTSDRLYFEPLTLEDTLAICAKERARGTLKGVIVQLGGQTPLGLAGDLERAGIPLLGTPAEAIDRAEDRERFGHLLAELGLRAPRWRMARTLDEARLAIADIGFPVVLRPSYVLGGRAMERVDDLRGLADYFARAATSQAAGSPLLIDEFLSDAIELDVDVLADRTGAIRIGGVMEHIDPAGIHSGDSACALPPYSLPPATVAEIERQTCALARELGVIGLMNAQFAVQGDAVYVLEVNPRAARTVPFASKAVGLPLARLATELMLGRTLEGLGVDMDHTTRSDVAVVAVKEAVFSFAAFGDVEPSLGPEMRSTGEVMGVDTGFASAFAKAQLAAGHPLPVAGAAFVSLPEREQSTGAALARRLVALGFTLLATHSTAVQLCAHGLPAVALDTRADPDALKRAGVTLVIDTTRGAQTTSDARALRRAARLCGIAHVTSLRRARATIEAIAIQQHQGLTVHSLQHYHQSFAD